MTSQSAAAFPFSTCPFYPGNLSTTDGQKPVLFTDEIESQAPGPWGYRQWMYLFKSKVDL